MTSISEQMGHPPGTPFVLDMAFVVGEMEPVRPPTSQPADALDLAVIAEADVADDVALELAAQIVADGDPARRDQLLDHARRDSDEAFALLVTAEAITDQEITMTVPQQPEQVSDERRVRRTNAALGQITRDLGMADLPQVDTTHPLPSSPLAENGAATRDWMLEQERDATAAQHEWDQRSRAERAAAFAHAVDSIDPHASYYARRR